MPPLQRLSVGAAFLSPATEADHERQQHAYIGVFVGAAFLPPVTEAKSGIYFLAIKANLLPQSEAKTFAEPFGVGTDPTI